MTTTQEAVTGSKSNGPKKAQEIESVTIRFAGDSGDGIQLTGGQFTTTTAMAGNDLSTFPELNCCSSRSVRCQSRCRC